MRRLLLLSPALFFLFASASQAAAGDAFYSAPENKIQGKPGTVIWQRQVKSGPTRIKGSSSTILILYRSLSVSGKPIAVSGLLDLPKGKTPKGGFKLISYAHGTTGMADACAPSRATTSSPAYGYVAYTAPMLSSWIKKGYAVARTDYEGLGTPGPHPYLIGDSAGRGVVDIVQAARAVSGKVSKEYAVAGHSQGGQAALFAAQGSRTWAPSLKLKGTLAFAPASHIYDQKTLLPALTAPSALSTLAAMILTSAARQSGKDPASFLSPEAAAFLPDLERLCTAELNAPSSLAGLAPSGLIASDDGSLDDTLKAMNPSVKSSAPLAILQGDADTTVFPFLTARLKEELAGTKLTYKTYSGLDHSGVVTDKKSQGDATAWLAARLR